jgi:hypothetical protein
MNLIENGHQIEFLEIKEIFDNGLLNGQGIMVVKET